jgi:hypothetical protein
MFTPEEKNNLVARLVIVLEQNKAGQSSNRTAVAIALADETIAYLTGLVTHKGTPEDKKNKTGMHQLSGGEASAGDHGQ